MSRRAARNRIIASRGSKKKHAFHNAAYVLRHIVNDLPHCEVASLSSATHCELGLSSYTYKNLLTQAHRDSVEIEGTGHK